MSWFSNRCPGCKNGRIFQGLTRMNPRCPGCGRIFERESGYFIGAMIASYFLGTFLALPTLLLAVFRFELEMGVAIFLCATQIVVLQPFLFRYSRILWIQIEASLTRSVGTPDPGNGGSDP